MYCRNCGKENEDGAKFCGYCGSPMESEKEHVEVPEKPVKVPAEKEKRERKGKKKGKIGMILCLILLLLAAAVAGGIALKKQQIKKQYNSAVATGDKYLEKMEYEKAEAAYLEAIQIDQKQKEPYLKLIDIYIEDGKYKKAVDLAEEAKENVPKEEQQEFDEIIDEWENVEEYTWVVDPEIEADELDYLKSNHYWDYSWNDLRKQKETSYAVIGKGDSYSLIDMDGNLADEMNYKRVSLKDDNYLLTSKTKKYDPVLYVDNDLYEFDEKTGRINPIGNRGSDWTGGTFYCYNGSIFNSMEGNVDLGENMVSLPDYAIPLQQSDSRPPTDYDVYEWENNLSGKYAICKGGKLVTDFEYDNCGSSVSGILAVEKNGKWGYVDEDGKIVIPIEYDNSWMIMSVMGENEYAQMQQNPFCYAASNGYVPLVKDGKWEMRRADGTLAIPSGIFEAIRPVQEGNRCWVKKDGKWGVICLGKEAK